MVKERIKGRKNYPTDEVDPKSFLSDETIKELINKKDIIKFRSDDYNKLYNCVHCGECETETERISLKQKYIEDGNTYEGINEMLEYFEKYRSPYPTNKMRIKRPKEILSESDTLFFMGCLSTIRIPQYTEHALQYLIQQEIDFTILDTEICCGWHLKINGLNNEYEICKKENREIFNSKKFREIICLCPACYYLFKNEMDGLNAEVNYISDYLKAINVNKTGRVGVQHLCQLMNRGKEGVDRLIDDLLKIVGYEVVDIPHWCCGGGSGWMGRTDVIERIARKRMSDFDREDLEYVTTYCPSCWWILRRFSKQCKIHPKAIDLFELIL
ncbi:MAG: (Fe-S)-binding protein [Candidatus Lokiarchaeota archaeon]|nr:(Fe-S)-binding protein [Candidatus Lokiarchaeota archaeon]